MPPLRCPFCLYEWYYKGDKRLATCPSCLRKISVSQNTIDRIMGETERKVLQYILEHDRKLAEKLIDKQIVRIECDDTDVEVHIVARDGNRREHEYITRVPVELFFE